MGSSDILDPTPHQAPAADLISRPRPRWRVFSRFMHFWFGDGSESHTLNPTPDPVYSEHKILFVTTLFGEAIRHGLAVQLLAKSSCSNFPWQYSLGIAAHSATAKGRTQDGNDPLRGLRSLILP